MKIRTIFSLILILSWSAYAEIADDTPRIIDNKFGVLFPFKIQDLSFDSMSIQKGYYEVRYSHEPNFQDLTIRLLENDRTFPVYELKAHIRDTKPVVELSDDELIRQIFHNWKDRSDIKIDTDWTVFSQVHYCTYLYTWDSRRIGYDDNRYVGDTDAEEFTVFKCMAILRLSDLTMVFTKKYADKSEFDGRYEQDLTDLIKQFSNQRVDPTSANAQSIVPND